MLVGLDTRHLSLATLGALVVNSLGYQLQRDWFNLSPQAPPEVLGIDDRAARGLRAAPPRASARVGGGDCPARCAVSAAGGDGRRVRVDPAAGGRIG